MQVALHVVREVLVQFLLCISDLSVLKSCLLTLVDQSCVLFTVEETWNLTRGQ